MCLLVNVRFDLVLDSNLAIKFRRAAFEKWNHKKGALSYAFEEAILTWIKKNSHSRLTQKSRNRSRRRLRR